MKFNIRGNKMEITEAIKNYIEKKLGKLNKYFENPDELTANVLVKSNGLNQTVEITIPIKKSILRAEESHKDLYAAIDIITDKLERQIRKNKTRSKNKKATENLFIDFEISDEEAIEEPIVKRKVIDNKPMSEEEAVLQMNLLGHEFFIFENTKTSNMSVIYRRKDGNYGIIEIR
ncbi:MAG: ribosome-associated translation inhibitor RaiA [Bacilli bacterium]|nr:ribosome-associated translation inhibitor RaiA [Bacilli bacterium]